MSGLSAKLRKYAVNAKEWYDMDVEFLTQAADALEASDKTIEELCEALEEVAVGFVSEGYHLYAEDIRALISQAQSKDKAECNPNTPQNQSHRASLPRHSHF